MTGTVRLLFAALSLVGCLVPVIGVLQSRLLVVDASQVIDGRRLVNTRRGLAVENKYIATIVAANKQEAGEKTKDIENKIKEWKKTHATSMLQSAHDDEPSTEIAMGYRAFLVFSGSPDLYDYVVSLMALPEYSSIVQVEEDLVVSSSAAPPSWGLDRIDQTNLPLSKTPFARTYTGRGIKVYIIDTGINKDHNEFAIYDGTGQKTGSRASYGNDYINEGYPQDGNGHGSHCSGTATGNTFGIANDASVIGVKVLSASGYGSTSGVISGIQFATTDSAGVAAVLSMSLGSGASASMNQAAAAAAEAGNIVVVAAGNNNNDACGSSPAGAGGSARTTYGVITVMASDSNDSRAYYSSFGRCTDIIAPGSGITSAWKGTASATNTLSGTSMATPHVAGVAAVLLHKHNGNKTAAMYELFASAAVNKIRDVMTDSKNLLLQMPIYVAPPTPTTLAPTMAPSPPPATLCVDDVCASPFLPATYGPAWEETTSTVQGVLAVASTDLCHAPPSGTDYTGKVVLVERGNCYFYTKTMEAQKKGAVGVIMYMADSSDPFPPTYYFDDPAPTIFTFMISRVDGLRFLGREGLFLFAGVPHTLRPTAFPSRSPSARPTARPTATPLTARPTASPSQSPIPRPPINCMTLKRKACLSDSRCAWFTNPENKEASCDFKENTSAPTPRPTALTPGDRCVPVPYAVAAVTCANIGLRLCTTRELLLAPGDEECGYDTKLIWTADSCGDGSKSRAVRTKNKRKSCRDRTESFGVRCCSENGRRLGVAPASVAQETSGHEL